MQMEWLRFCYKSSMRLYRGDRSIVVPGRWCWCAKGALALPFVHAFASQQWDWQTRIDPDIGEVIGVGQWYSGRADERFSGQRYCGSPTLFRLGSPLSLRGKPVVGPDGYPPCCDAPTKPISARAVLVIGSQSVYRWGNVMDSTGGVEVNGVGDFGNGYRGEGGGQLDASGSWGEGFTSTGGVEADGVGLVGLGWPGRGGTELDGVGSWGYGWLVAAAGVEADGVGLVGLGWPAVEGGVEADGVGDFSGGSSDDMPIGTICWYPSATPPANWLLCDGSTFSGLTYPALATLIGSTFGGSNVLPNIQSRSIVCAGTGSGLSTRTLAATGGEENHTLSTSEIPSHTHAGDANTYLHTGAVQVQSGLFGFPATFGAGTLGNTGGDGSHNTMHPYIVLYAIIRAL